MISALVSIFLVSTSAIISSVYTDTNSDWYQCAKPNNQPPGYVFMYVWTFLYLCLMYLTYKIIKSGSKSMLFSMVIILILCSLWSITFFYLHRADISAGILVCIWIFSWDLLFNLIFLNKKKRGGIDSILIIPFIAWISYALFLNMESSNKNCNNLI